MKKVIVFSIVLLLCVTCFASNVCAVENVINARETSKIIEISETQKEELADYVEDYGSETYGLTAFILNKIRIFSIPFCFLGIVISAVYQYVLGIRKLDIRYKGFYTMIAFVTLLVIAQILPLVFVIVIKGFGRS